MYTKIDHLGIVVKNLDQALEVYRDTLGFQCAGVASFPDLGVRRTFLPVGESFFHLIEPSDPQVTVRFRNITFHLPHPRVSSSGSRQLPGGRNWVKPQRVRHECIDGCMSSGKVERGFLTLMDTADSKAVTFEN